MAIIEGATPMYAQVVASGEVISLKHLAGVLRVAPKGEGVTLVSMSLEAENGKLAGNFNLDCATGTLTPQSTATNSVSVTFGDTGLTLGADETPIYVAVPAGEYGMITVTLYTATDSMTLNFDTTGDKSVKAGIIREFTPFNYVANSTESDTFLIYDEASLRRFAEKAADFAPYTKAKVSASIDMTGKEWESISGFGAYEFDGGNKTIKGLSAPLFDTTATSIKNVRLTEIDMTVTGADAAALACCISSENAVVENCYVQGKFTIDAATPAAIHDGALQYGGIIGWSASTQEFSGLTADIEIIAPGNFGTLQTRIGGVLGMHAGKLSNSTNLGTITFTGKISETPILSGVAHICNGGMENCNNGSADDKSGKKGAIIVNGNITKNLLVSGLNSYGNGTYKNCNNYGNITVDCEKVGGIFIAGWVARTQTPMTIENCSNYGDISIECAISEVRIGGLVSEDFSDAQTFTNCHNYGDITLTGDASFSKACVVGGLYGYKNDAVAISFSSCTNNGKITLKKGVSTAANLHLGGMVAYCNGKGNTTLTSCTNNGIIEVEEGANVSSTYIGGFTAYKAAAGKLTLDSCTNKGAITFNGTGSSTVQVSGILGSYIGNEATLVTKNETKNEGTLTVGGSASDAVRVAGIIAAFTQTWSSDADGSSIRNKGDINVSIEGPSRTSLIIGGCVGATARNNPGGVTWYNEGDITTETAGIVGGAIGSITTDDITVKNANVYCNIKAPNANGVGMIQGSSRKSAIFCSQCNFGGSIWKKDMTEAVTLNLDNFYHYAYNSDESRETIVTTDVMGYISSIDDTPKYALPTTIGTVDELLAFAANPTAGNITLTADIDLTEVEWTPIEGFAGSFDGSGYKIIGLKQPLFGTTTSMVSLQNIHLTEVAITRVGGEEATLGDLGALACSIDNSEAVIRNCTAEGSITISGKFTNTTSRVSGIVGTTSTTKKISGLVNKVNITIGDDLIAIYAGGCVGSASQAIVDNSQNYGTITLNGRYGRSMLIGGVVATCAGVTNCTNGSEKVGEKQVLGKITFNGESYATANRYIDIAGICVFTNATASVASGCKNYGAIDCGGNVITGGNAMIRLGGVFSNVDRIANGAVTNCENHGDLTISTKYEGGKNSMISGVCTTVAAGLNLLELSDLHNYGKITITKEASFAKDLLIGGIMMVFDVPRTYKNLYNHGDITVEAINIGGDLQLGGITGRVKSDTSTGSFEGTLGNEGTISVAATVSGTTCIGGVFGNYNNPNCSINVINTGDIDLSGTFNGTYYLGGVCGGGSGAGNITNAKCYCNLYTGNYPAGFIIGVDRSETCKAINCAVGGMRVTEWDYEDDTPRAKGDELSEGNYFDFIYASQPVWDNDNYDGCTLLSTKPALQ